MKKQTAGRFVRAIRNRMRRYDYDGYICIDLTGQDIAKLMWAEHRAVLRIVAQEPELPDDMPDEIWHAIQADRDTATEVMRLVVRKTKANILDQLRRRAK